MKHFLPGGLCYPGQWPLWVFRANGEPFLLNGPRNWSGRDPLPANVCIWRVPGLNEWDAEF